MKILNYLFLSLIITGFQPAHAAKEEIISEVQAAEKLTEIDEALLKLYPGCENTPVSGVCADITALLCYSVVGDAALNPVSKETKRDLSENELSVEACKNEYKKGDYYHFDANKVKTEADFDANLKEFSSEIMKETISKKAQFQNIVLTEIGKLYIKAADSIYKHKPQVIWKTLEYLKSDLEAYNIKNRTKFKSYLTAEERDKHYDKALWWGVGVGVVAVYATRTGVAVLKGGRLHRLAKKGVKGIGRYSGMGLKFMDKKFLGGKFSSKVLKKAEVVADDAAKVTSSTAATQGSSFNVPANSSARKAGASGSASEVAKAEAGVATASKEQGLLSKIFGGSGKRFFRTSIINAAVAFGVAKIYQLNLISRKYLNDPNIALQGAQDESAQVLRSRLEAMEARLEEILETEKRQEFKKLPADQKKQMHGDVTGYFAEINDLNAAIAYLSRAVNKTGATPLQEILSLKESNIRLLLERSKGLFADLDTDNLNKNAIAAVLQKNVVTFDLWNAFINEISDKVKNRVKDKTEYYKILGTQLRIIKTDVDLIAKNLDPLVDSIAAHSAYADPVTGDRILSETILKSIEKRKVALRKKLDQLIKVWPVLEKESQEYEKSLDDDDDLEGINLDE